MIVVQQFTLNYHVEFASLTRDTIKDRHFLFNRNRYNAIQIVTESFCAKYSPAFRPISPTWSHSHSDLPFHTTFLLCTRPEAFELRNTFQFLYYYIHRLSVSLFILFESEIRKLSFQHVNPHPSFSSSDYFHVPTHSVIFTSLPPKGSPTMSSENILDSGSYFLTPYVSTSMSMRNMYGLKADHWCNSTSTLNLLLSPPTTHAAWFDNPSTMSWYQFNILFWYVELPRVSPYPLLRYPIVCLGIKIASVVPLLGMNPN